MENMQFHKTEDKYKFITFIIVRRQCDEPFRKFINMKIRGLFSRNNV